MLSKILLILALTTTSQIVLFHLLKKLLWQIVEDHAVPPEEEAGEVGQESIRPTTYPGAASASDFNTPNRITFNDWENFLHPN